MNTPTHLVINRSLARGSGADYPFSAVQLGAWLSLPLFRQWFGVETGEA